MNNQQWTIGREKKTNRNRNNWEKTNQAQHNILYVWKWSTENHFFALNRIALWQPAVWVNINTAIAWYDDLAVTMWVDHGIKSVKMMTFLPNEFVWTHRITTTTITKKVKHYNTRVQAAHAARHRILHFSHANCISHHNHNAQWLWLYKLFYWFCLQFYRAPIHTPHQKWREREKWSEYANRTSGNQWKRFAHSSCFFFIFLPKGFARFSRWMLNVLLFRF